MSKDLFSPHEENYGCFYFLTNSMNLLTILAGGVVYPASLSWRYVPDSRELFGNVIPVWRDAFPIELQHYWELDGSEAAVVIEFSDSLKVWADKSGARILDSVILFSSPIPLRLVKKVYFNTQAALEEFRLRAFDEIPMPENIFSSEINPAFLPDLISPGMHMEMHPQALLTDKCAGALIASSDSLFATMSNIRVFEFFISRIIGGQGEFLAEDLVALDSEISIGCAERVQAIADAWLLNAILNILRDTSPENGLDSFKVADIISNAVGSLELGAEKIVLKWCVFAKKLINAEEEIRPLEDKKSIIQRAVLLFLMRPSNERIHKSIASSIKPGAKVYLIGNLIAGFYTGAVQMKSSAKNDPKRFFALMDFVLQGCLFEKHTATESWTRKVKRISDDEMRLTLSYQHHLVGEWKLRLNDTLKQVYHQIRRLEFSIRCDYENEELICENVNSALELPVVRIRLIKPNLRWEDLIRFYSLCRTGPRSKLLSKEIAADLLIKNFALDMPCKFAYSERHKAIVVSSEQSVNTMDKDELISHIEYVSNTAKRYSQKN